MSSHCKKCGQPLPEFEANSVTRSRSASYCEACRDATISTGGVFSNSAETASLLQSPLSGNRIAQFELVRIVGRGSFGEVWLSNDSRLNREVALKLPNANRPGTSALLYEAKTVARLRHPHIVAVYEVGEVKGQFYIASEFIDGVTLSDFLSAGKPPLSRVIEILIPIAEALQFAHSHGVVHRDVKPSNILMNQEGKPYVTDFGLAKHLTADESISSQGQVVGTVRYMSPEQAIGNTSETDARSDLYSVGVMMFEMLTGESPFRGTARAVLHQKVIDDAPSLRLLEPSIPRDIETICLKCLERDPSRRFENANYFVDELKRYVAGEPIQSRPISRVERGWRWCRRRPAISSLVVALFLSLVTGLVGVSHFAWRAAQSSTEAKQKLYRSWMTLAARNLESGSPAGVRDLLARVSADPDLVNLRSFEYGYFTNMVSPIVPIGSVGDSVVDVAISHDGNTGAATSGGQSISVWNTSNGELLRKLQASQDGFTAIDFSSANSQLVAGSVDGMVRVYEPLASDKMIRQFQHGPPVYFTAFAPDGRYLVTAGLTGAVRMWDSDSGELVAELPTGKGQIRAVRFSPNSSRLYIARDDGRLREWSIAALRESGIKSVPVPTSEFDTAPAPVAMSVSADGKQLVIAFYNGNILTHDLLGDATASQQRTHKFNIGLIQDVEHIPGTWSVAITTSIGSLYIFDTQFQREVRFVKTHAATGRLSQSGNGNTLLLGSGDGSVSIIAPRELLKPTVLWSDSPVRSVAFIEAQKLVAAHEDGTLVMWDLATGIREPLDSESLGSAILVAVNASRKLVASAGSKSGVDIRELESRDRLVELPTSAAGVSAMRFSPSDALLVVAIRKGPVRLYSVDDWLQPRVEVMQDELVHSVAVSLDSRMIAVARDSGTVDILDSADGSVTDTISLELDHPTVVEFCQDAATLAVGTSGGELLFYDIPSRTVRSKSKWHTGRVNALAVLPSSNLIVSAGRDKNLNLWDLESGDLVTQLLGHFRQIFTVAVSDDGKTIVSGGLEGDIRVWRSQ